MLPMVHAEPVLLKCGDRASSTPPTSPPPETDADDIFVSFFDIDVAFERFESCDLQLGDTWRGMQSKMSVTAPVKKIRKKSDSKPQSQLSKCKNEKKRRELENETINQLEELLGTCLAEVKQPDKNGIVREATRQIQEVLKRRRHCPADCPVRLTAPPSPLQQGDVSSTEQYVDNYSEITTLIEALKYYTIHLDWVLLELNSKGEIECITDNIDVFTGHNRVELFKESIFTIVHPDDHAKFRPLLKNIQTFIWGNGVVEKFAAIQARLIVKTANGTESSGEVEALIQCASVRGPVGDPGGRVMCVIRRAAEPAPLPEPQRPPTLPAHTSGNIVFRLDADYNVLTCDLKVVENFIKSPKSLVGLRYLDLIEPSERHRIASDLQQARSLPSPPVTSKPFRLRVNPDKPWVRVVATSRLFNSNLSATDPDFIMSTHTVLSDEDASLGSGDGPVGGPLMTSVANGDPSTSESRYREPNSPTDSFSMNDFEMDSWPATFQLNDMDESKEKHDSTSSGPLTPLTPRTPATPGDIAPPPPSDEPNKLRSLLINKGPLTPVLPSDPPNRILKDLLKQEDEDATSSDTSAPTTPHTGPHTPHTAPHTPHTAPHTPHTAPLTPHTAPHTPHTAPLTPHTAPHTPHTAPLTPHTAPLTPHTAPLTPHTAPLTPHTAPLTPHTAPLTPHTGPHTPHTGPHTPHTGPHTPHTGPHTPHTGPHTPHTGPHTPHTGPHTPHTPGPPVLPVHHHQSDMLLRILNDKDNEDNDENRRNSTENRMSQPSALLSQLLASNGPSSNGRLQESTASQTSSEYLERFVLKRKIQDANSAVTTAKRATPESQMVSSSAVGTCSTSTPSPSSGGSVNSGGGGGMSELCQKNQILVSLLARQQTSPTTPLPLPNPALRPVTPRTPRPAPLPANHPANRHHATSLSNMLTQHNSRMTTVNGGSASGGGNGGVSGSGGGNGGVSGSGGESHLEMVLAGGPRQYAPAPPPHYSSHTNLPYHPPNGGSSVGGSSVNAGGSDQALSDLLDEVIDVMPDRTTSDLVLDQARHPRHDYTGIKEENDMINAIRQSLMQCERVTKSPVPSSSGPPPVYPVQNTVTSVGGARGEEVARARALAEQHRARLLQRQRNQQLLVPPEAAESPQSDLGSTISALVSETPPNVSLKRTDYHHMYHSNQMSTNYGGNKMQNTQPTTMLNRQISSGGGVSYSGGVASPAALHTPLSPAPAYVRPLPPRPAQPPPPPLGAYYEESGAYCGEYRRLARPAAASVAAPPPVSGGGGGGGGGGTSEFVRNELRAVVGARSSRPDLHAPLHHEYDSLLGFEMPPPGGGSEEGGRAAASWDATDSPNITGVASAAAAAVAGGDETAAAGTASKASLLQKLLSQ